MKNWFTPANRYLVYSIAIVIIFTFIFAELAIELFEDELFHFDYTIIQWIQSLINPKPTLLMKFFTFIGSAQSVAILLIISIIVMIHRNKIWESIFLFGAVTGGTLFNQLLKFIFHRERPGFIRLIEETGYSFPSGHAMISFIFFGMIGYFLYLFFESNRWQTLSIALSIVMILMIGTSRIYLGVHYPSDVLAGYAAGGAWLAACIMGLKAIEKTKQQDQN